MNWDAVGAIGESVGAIAVIATLIYLAIQIRQNTRSVKAGAHQTWATTVIAEQSAGMQESTAKAISDDNWVRFANYCNLFLHKAESAYYLQKSNIIEQALSEKELERAVAFLKTGGPAQWWGAGAKTQFTDEFVEYIEAKMLEPTTFQVYDFTPGIGFHPHQKE